MILEVVIWLSTFTYSAYSDWADKSLQKSDNNPVGLSKDPTFEQQKNFVLKRKLNPRGVFQNFSVDSKKGLG